MCNATAVTALVTENTGKSVSASTCLPVVISARPPQTSTTCLPLGHYLQADLATFADGGVNGFLDHAIWIRCHSTPSPSFLEPPICPPRHSLPAPETPSAPLSFLPSSVARTPLR